MRRDAMEWAATQVKARATVDLNRPNPSGELWLDRLTWWPEINARSGPKYGPVKITLHMRNEMRRYRRAAGLSAAAVCRKAGVDQTYLSMVECGNVTRTSAETWNDMLAVCKAEIAERAAELQQIQREWEAA